VIGWFRFRDADEDVWFHYEVDDDGWVSRQVDLTGAEGRYVTAASLVEVVRARDFGGLTAVRAYEARFGVLAEGGGNEALRDWPGVEEIGAEEFERLWVAARRALGAE
jgi:hypothetical protein